jgi:regulator of sirC expression with transglutaminase-like and TPR domain
MKRGQAFEILNELKNVGHLADENVDLARTALLLSAINHPGISLERYETHLKNLSEYVGLRFDELIRSGASDDLYTRVAALKHILSDRYGYNGNTSLHGELESYDLIRVIENREGADIALSILYIHAARHQNWDVCGLSFPGHFLVRMDYEGQRVIFDPYSGCSILQAPELREIVKQELGESAELSSSYYEACKNKDILIKLENHIKFRLIEDESYPEALETVDLMRLVDPSEYRLLLDAGVLYSRNQRYTEAIEALEAYIKAAPSERDRHDAAILLQEIREQESE